MTLILIFGRDLGAAGHKRTTVDLDLKACRGCQEPQYQRTTIAATSTSEQLSIIIEGCHHH